MEQNTAWETNSPFGLLKKYHHLWNRKFQFRFHKSPSLAYTLSHSVKSATHSAHNSHTKNAKQDFNAVSQDSV
jgi:hypothetical protein